MSAYEHPELIALDEVEDILDAYAEARLSPSGPLLSRMRAAVLAEANATAVAQATRTAAAAARPAPRRWHRLATPRLDGARWQVPRLAATLGFAVALGLGTSTAVTAAPPGSPFYNARVALESLLLPTQIDERLAAHEQHLDARLADAEAGEDFDRLSKLQAVLEKHVATLSALAERLPTAAARDNAIEHALQVSQKAVTKVQDQKAHAGNRPVVPPSQANQPSRPPAPAGQDAGPENRPLEPGR